MKIILVYGMSGSGKTTISYELKEYFKQQNLNTTILPLDYFYKVGPQKSFDVPDAFDWKKLQVCINHLNHNQPYTLYPYIYETNVYDKSKPTTIFKTSTIIIEGIYANYAEFLSNYDPIVLHINTPPDISLARRCLRDAKERNITPEINIKRWLDDVKPNWNTWQNTHNENILETSHTVSGEHDAKLERNTLYQILFYRYYSYLDY